MSGSDPPEHTVIVPPSLRRGSKLRVVAPSGPFDRTLFWRGLGWLSQYHRPAFDQTIFESEGFLAGSDERRRVEFQCAIDDPEASAIVVARGGWGAARFANSIDFSGLLAHPKWLVGFSDPTILHVHAWKVGVASMHASNLVGLGRGDEQARRTWLQALEFPGKPRVIRGRGLCPGRISGTLAGGNLTVLVTSLAMGTLRFPDNCILALEDVSESSYRIDRLLHALLSTAVVDRVVAFALGQFIDCESGNHRVEVSTVLCEQLQRTGVPVVVDLPFGHGSTNTPLPLGTPATLDGAKGELSVGDF